MQKASIEHIEKDFIMCESLTNGEKIYLERYLLPKGAKEGDVIDISKDKVEINSSETAKRKNKIFTLQSEIFNQILGGIFV